MNNLRGSTLTTSSSAFPASSLRELTCATCGSAEYTVRYDARLPPIEALDFSARRSGGLYHPRIVECRKCGQVYSNPFFSEELIARLYRQARYIAEPQLGNMARDYVREFEKAIALRSNKKELRILEIGCADGFFLQALKEAGYTSLTGVEPGQDAYSRTRSEIKPLVLNDFFGPGTFPPDSFDVVCCFQLMDHVPQPAVFVKAIRQVLTDGGIFLTINHNIRALQPRLLGERSPMYDVEHIYLFDRFTIARLLTDAGFEVRDCRALYNSYTLDYALKMFPMPGFLRRAAVAVLTAVGLASWSVRVAAGNMITVGHGTRSV